MKILWFTNTPCGASKRLKIPNISGGWLESLENEITQSESINLFISFYTNENIKPFKLSKTSYYPIYRPNFSSKTKRFINRFLNREGNTANDLGRLLSIINEIKPDLIHIHGTESNFGIIIDHTDIPIVFSIQGILSSIKHKFYAGIPQNIAKKYEGIREKCYLISSKWIYSNIILRADTERKILQSARYVIGRTYWDKNITQLLAPQSLYFTGNEILRDGFYINKWGKDSFSNKLQIVSIVSNALYKGFETILLASEILCSYGYSFEWSVIGVDKNDSVVKIAEKWLKLSHFNQNIKLLGKKDEDDVISILKSSDIFCQVSHIENSSNSLCEAMMLGMPIIASFAGGTDSLLENRKEGLLVQDGDPFSFAGAILYYCKEFEKAKFYANQARITALDRHSRTKIKADYINIYSSILGRDQ